jgi:hypothetical protein
MSILLFGTAEEDHGIEDLKERLLRAYTSNYTRFFEELCKYRIILISATSL